MNKGLLYLDQLGWMIPIFSHSLIWPSVRLCGPQALEIVLHKLGHLIWDLFCAQHF
jgi:hypothetical protein